MAQIVLRLVVSYSSHYYHFKFSCVKTHPRSPWQVLYLCLGFFKRYNRPWFEEFSRHFFSPLAYVFVTYRLNFVKMVMFVTHVSEEPSHLINGSLGISRCTFSLHQHAQSVTRILFEHSLWPSPPALRVLLLLETDAINALARKRFTIWSCFI